MLASACGSLLYFAIDETFSGPGTATRVIAGTVLRWALCLSPGQGRSGTVAPMKDSFCSARRHLW